MASSPPTQRQGKKVARTRQSTLIFRLINPELFIKPNKVVMVFGVLSITGCVMYLSYMNSTKSGRQPVSAAVQRSPNKSKWD